MGITLWRRNEHGIDARAPLAIVPPIRESERNLSRLDSRGFGDALSELRKMAQTLFGSGEQKMSSSEYMKLLFKLRVLATAMGAEAVSRTHGFRLHDVQLAGAMAVAFGAIAEMQTGEGKTIVTGVAAFVRSLQFPYVHVATTNQYLASRDCKSLSELFQMLGVSAQSLPEENDLAASQSAYDCRITYGPGYQFGFDFLRDQVALRQQAANRLGGKVLEKINGIDSSQHLIQRSRHHAMIIDEADSVMIDEAVTPLVLSGPGQSSIDDAVFMLAKEVAEEFVEGVHFNLTPDKRKIELTDQANDDLFQPLKRRVGNVKLDRPWIQYIQNSLQAKHVLKKDEDYIVDGDAVLIVDQMTGRIFPDRNWKSGLHQAVECKEGVTIKPGSEAIARITRQNYFQFYPDLSGLTGTAEQVRRELKEVYDCPVIMIPTHKPSSRIIERARYFVDAQSKLDALAVDIKSRHAQGQPVLVGARTIHESRRIQKTLVQLGLEPVVLNGTQDADEATVISKAGKKGAVTIATNMAGRGTDIKVDEECVQLGGLHVVATEHNHSRRVDRQLMGRCARQGNPGSVQFFVSADDELLKSGRQRFTDAMRTSGNQTGECTQDFAGEIIALQESFEKEGYRNRQALVRQDKWMDTIRQSVDR